MGLFEGLMQGALNSGINSVFNKINKAIIPGGKHIDFINNTIVEFLNENMNFSDIFLKNPENDLIFNNKFNDKYIFEHANVNEDKFFAFVYTLCFGGKKRAKSELAKFESEIFNSGASFESKYKVKNNFENASLIRSYLNRTTDFINDTLPIYENLKNYESFMETYTERYIIICKAENSETERKKAIKGFLSCFARTISTLKSSNEFEKEFQKLFLGKYEKVLNDLDKANQIKISENDNLNDKELKNLLLKVDYEYNNSLKPMDRFIDLYRYYLIKYSSADITSSINIAKDEIINLCKKYNNSLEKSILSKDICFAMNEVSYNNLQFYLKNC